MIMYKAVSVVAFVAGMALASSAPALANSKENGGGSGPSAGVNRGQKQDWQGSNTPPGWHHGEKQGWHGSSTPPGWHHGDKTGGATPHGSRKVDRIISGTASK
jgi:hypothetical protein